MDVDYDVLIVDADVLEDDQILKTINKINSIKILASYNNNKFDKFNFYLKLPTTVNHINYIVENSVAKKLFNKNSSIKINNYHLDQNERKLIKDNTFLILTEKEVQLLKLFLTHKKPISKKNILSLVWHYSSDADTHTVETHIYRLRKKINDKFYDEKFILNNKDGYFL